MTYAFRSICVLLVAGAVSLAVASLSGCSSPTQQARQKLAAGQPMHAVYHYEQAVRQRPHDTALREELNRARRIAADDLADQVERALNQGRDDDALRIARQAGSLNEHYLELVLNARIRKSTAFLQRAEALYSEGAYDAARTMAERALQAAPGRDEIDSLLERINRAAAEEVYALAVEAMEDEQFDRARRFALRAAELDPHTPRIVKLPATIDHAERTARFRQTAASVERALNEGNLARAKLLHPRLVDLDIDPERTAALKSRIDEQQREFDRLVTLARSARDAGAYETAVEHYSAARLIGRDIEQVTREHRLTVRQRDAVRDLHRAARAVEVSDFDLVELLLAEIGTVQLTPLYDQQRRSVRQQLHHHRLNVAMASQDYLAALHHIDALLLDDESNDLRNRRERIAQQAVEAAQQQAIALRARDDLHEAITLLDQTLELEPDEQLAELRRDMYVDYLVQHAVAAEQGYDYHTARHLYLEAMALADNRDDIADRLRQVDHHIELQRQLEAHRQEALQLRAELERRQREQAEFNRYVLQQHLIFEQQQLRRLQDRHRRELRRGVYPSSRPVYISPHRHRHRSDIRFYYRSEY